MSKRIIKSSLYIIASILSSASLISLGSANSVYAETVDYNVNIEPSLVVTIPSNTVELNINPVTTQFNSANLSVTVGTNNATGYTLTMSSDSTDLSKAGSVDTIPTLETLAGGYPEADFTVNHWGYKLSTATNYLPFAASNELDVTNVPTNSKTSIVNFAAKADLSKPAGTYKLAIDFTAVANYVPPVTVDFCTNNNIADADCMQKMVASNCTTTAKTVMDSRDGEQYKVQRLADGNCWLLDNLRLDPTEPQVQVNLSVNTTNASDQTLDYLLNGGGTTSDKYPTAGLGNLTEGHSFSVPRINATYKETINSDASLNYGEGSHMYGVYYNYCAASAGSYCYGNGSNDYGTPEGDASEDICPAGWRMPTSDSGGEYQALYDEYSSASEGQDVAFRNALSTPLSGYFDSSPADLQGSYGFFWSSTRYNVCNMYFLYIDSSSVDPRYNITRTFGSSVRCLLK